MRILLGQQICILHQQSSRSLKDLQMCWSRLQAWLALVTGPLFLSSYAFIGPGSSLAFSPAWKNHIKAPGISWVLTLFTGDFGLSGSPLLDSRPDVFTGPTDAFLKVRKAFFFFLISAKTDTSRPKCGLNYSINSYCKMPKYFRYPSICYTEAAPNQSDYRKWTWNVFILLATDDRCQAQYSKKRGIHHKHGSESKVKVSRRPAANLRVIWPC